MKAIGRVKENRDVLKSRILEYARDAFCVYGIKDVTMDSIAGGLSISKRTLYEIFSDKEGLLLEIIKIHSQETREFIDKISKEADNVLDVIFKIYENNVKEIKKVNKLFFEEINKYPSVISYMQFSRDEMAAITMSNLKKGVTQGLFREDMNYEIIRSVMVEEVDILIRSKSNEKFPLVEIYENLVLMHVRGISTEKGLKKVNEFLSNMRLKQDKVSDNNNK